MKGLEFTILSHGFIENDLAWNVAMPRPAKLSDKAPTPVWIHVPSYSVLIKHPTEGYILYDTGSCPGDEKDRRPASMADYFPLLINRDEYLDSRLNELGISVDDISTVVVSHMHWDHCGGLAFFGKKGHQRVITSEKDFSFGLVETHRSSVVDDSCVYFKDNYEIPGLDFELITDDIELCPGIDLFLLEGHTPAVVGMVLHLESGNVIFPSDAVGSMLNYGPPARVPGIIYDTFGFHRAIKKLSYLEKKYDAKIIFPHDMEQFKTLKLSPFFYK